MKPEEAFRHRIEGVANAVQSYCFNCPADGKDTQAIALVGMTAKTTDRDRYIRNNIFSPGLELHNYSPSRLRACCMPFSKARIR
jgi:hypothetical protein